MFFWSNFGGIVPVGPAHVVLKLMRSPHLARENAVKHVECAEKLGLRDDGLLGVLLGSWRMISLAPFMIPWSETLPCLYSCGSLAMVAVTPFAISSNITSGTFEVKA